MADNAILRKNLPGGALQKENIDTGPAPAAEEMHPGKVVEVNYDSGWEMRLHQTTRPGLRVVRGGFEEGLDQVYAADDLIRWYVLHSGEEGMAYVYAEDDAGDAAVSAGDILYKTANGDHSTAHEGQLDVNATDGVATAIALEDVSSGESQLTKILKL